MRPRTLDLDRIAEEHPEAAKGFIIGAGAGMLLNIVDHYTSMAASSVLYGSLGAIGHHLLAYHRLLENDFWYPAGLPVTYAAAGIIIGATVGALHRKRLPFDS